MTRARDDARRNMRAAYVALYSSRVVVSAPATDAEPPTATRDHNPPK